MIAESCKKVLLVGAISVFRHAAVQYTEQGSFRGGKFNVGKHASLFQLCELFQLFDDRGSCNDSVLNWAVQLNGRNANCVPANKTQEECIWQIRRKGYALASMLDDLVQSNF